MLKELQDYRAFLKRNLLQFYKEDDNFDELMNNLTSNTVNNYQWTSSSEKMRIQEGLQKIERLNQIPPEDSPRYELYKIRKDILGLAGISNQDGYVQLLLLKKGNANKEDFMNIGLSEDEFNVLEARLLRNKKFIGWCKTFANQNLVPESLSLTVNYRSYGLGSMVISQLQQSQLHDSFLEDLNSSLDLSSGLIQTENDKRQKRVKRMKYLEQKIYQIQAQYGNDNFIAKSLREQYQLIKNPYYSINFRDYKQALYKEGKLQNGKLLQIIRTYQEYDAQTITLDSDMRAINQQLSPVDTYSCRIAKESSLSKMRHGLLVVGDQGVGKTIITSALLGSKFQEKSTRSSTKSLIIRHQHQKPVAVNTISTTQDLSVYNLTYDNMQIYLIDARGGFNDSNGKEKDISNEILIEKACESCETTCFLYLIEISAFNIGRPLLMICYAKNIASRFAYQNQEELSSMLLIVFNLKGDILGSQTKNLLNAAQNLLREKHYSLTNKQKIAFSLISKKIRQEKSLFSPFQSVDHIKQDIKGLSFSKSHKIMRKFDPKFNQKVIDHNKILENSIKFYLSNQRYNDAKYCYDQLCILDSTVGLQSTKMTKLRLEDWIENDVVEKQQKMNHILREKVSTLAATTQQLQNFSSLLISAILFISILKLNRIMDAIDSQINQAFQNVLNFINPEADDERIRIIPQICVFFFGKSEVKERLQKGVKDIEKMCLDKLYEIPEQVERQYRAENYQQFDKKLKSYIIFHKFYSVFSQKFPQQFNKLNQAKKPDHLKLIYTQKQSQGFQRYVAMIQCINDGFIKNSQIKSEDIEKFNACRRSMLNFEKSEYISLAKDVKMEQQKLQEGIYQKCTIFTNLFDKTLLFQETWANNNDGIKTMISNMQTIKDKITIQSIKNVVNRSYTGMVIAVQKTCDKFEQEMTYANSNINNLQLKTQYRLLSNMKEKLHFFSIFQISKKNRIQQKWIQFKQNIANFCNFIEISLKKEFKDYRLDETKHIFQRIKSLKRYVQIESEVDGWIGKIRSLNEASLRVYLQHLKQIITIKQIRSHSDYTLFNQNYIKAMNHYIEGILLNTYEDEDARSIHKDIYITNTNSLTNIDKVIDICIKLGRDAGSVSMDEDDETDRGLKMSFSINYHYLTALGEIYDNLKRITDKFYQYINNQIYVPQRSVEIDVQEMLSKIERLFESRYRIIRSFVTPISNIMNRTVGGPNIILNFQISDCNNYLKELQNLMTLHTKITHSGRQSNISQENLQQLHEEIDNIIGFYNNRQQDRIERAINVDNLTISNMHDLQEIYQELTNANSDTGSNTNVFISRLQSFVYSISERYQNTLRSCTDPLEADNYKNFIQAITYYLSLIIFIIAQDAAKITSFNKLTRVIACMWGEMKWAIENLFNNLEQNVELRNFDSFDREILQIQKIVRNMQDYLKEVKVKNPNALQDPDYQLAITSRFTERLQNIRMKRQTQAKTDLRIVESPMEGRNRQKVQDLYSSLRNSQLKHRIRQNINSHFTDLLQKYRLCEFSASQRLGKEITELWPYIPHQLVGSFDFKATYQELKRNKLAKERTQLDRLKRQKGTASLNAIIHKHNQFAAGNSFEMKEEAFEMVKSQINIIAAQIAASQKLNEKIQLAKEKFWNLRYRTIISQSEYFTEDIQNFFIVTEHQIFECIERMVIQALQQLGKMINEDNSIALGTGLIDEIIGNIHHFYFVFAQKRQIVHENQKYEQLIGRIRRNIAQWRTKFDLVCPFGQLQQLLNAASLNQNKVKNLMRKCAIKSIIYSIIFHLFPEQQPQLAQQVEQQYSMQIQFRSPSSPTFKIKEFRKKVDEHIKQLQAQLLAIKFEDYINLPRYDIEKALIQVDRSAAALELYELNLTCFNKDYQYEEPNTQGMIRAVQSKLKYILKAFLTNLRESFFDLYKEIPYELYFLETLFEIIATGYHKLFSCSIQLGQMMEEIAYSKYLSNPRAEFNAQINNCINDLEPDIINARRKFIQTKQLRHKLKEEVDDKRRKMTEELNGIYNQYKRTLQDIRRQNEGKTEAEQQVKLNEAEQQYLVDKEAIENKWNDLKMEVQNRYEELIAVNVRDYACKLLNLKKIQFNFQSSNNAKARLAEMLQLQLREVRTAKMVRVLAKALQDYNYQDYASLLKRDSPYFKFQQFVEFNHKTARQGIGYVIARMIFMLQNDNLKKKEYDLIRQHKQQLQNQYKNFIEYYSALLKNHDQQSIQTRIEAIISQYRNAGRVQRLAIILAVWSLQEKAKNFNDIQLNNEEGESMDINPHPVQVAALLLLTMKQQDSQLVQILTGEGKSIVLATLAIYLAKNDETPVVVSCYSSYLCLRDSKNFKNLFAKFRVGHLITYHTFNQICEKALNNPQHSTQQRIMAAITEGATREERMTIERSGKKAMLLIDQVDVLFQSAYFGNTFCPVMKLNDEDSRQLIKFAFEELERNPRVSTGDLAQSSPFLKLLARYPRIEHILRNQLHRMKRQFTQPENEYFVDQRMIKYKDKDRLSEKLNFGYETIFAYCREFKLGRVSQQHYENALFIPLAYGEFSYAELPKSYSSIIGLSGTIEYLPPEKINHLQERYGINKRNMYILPSIYGDNAQRVEMFSIQSDATYHREVIARIKEELERGRPVVVCFRDYAELIKFSNHEIFAQSQLKYTNLHEHLDNNLRDRCIMTVGTPQRLTLMTAEFSRGTDFIISDKKVQSSGGLHIILTYVPQLMSELIQLKGRTARQGQQGSIHAIIRESEAMQKNIICKYKEDIEDNLKQYMAEVGKAEQAQNKLKLEGCLKNHLRTQRYLESLNHTANEYIQYLFELNRVEVGRETPIKIIIGIDGTCSMQKTFQELIRQVRLIMSRIIELQNSASIKGSFIVQIVVYRNYNSGDKILVASEFEQDLERLSPFLEQISCEGGLGNEAIELLYRHINIQKDVDMLILIGDAPPNSEAQVKKNRKDGAWQEFMKKGQARDPLYQPTNCAEEQRNFPQNIIIHGLYIPGNKFVDKGSAKAYFEEVAQRHNGEVRQLNFSRQNYSEVLVEFFTTKIVIAVNGNKNQEEINEIYRRRFYTT